MANELVVREEGALMANDDILSPVMNLEVAKKRLQDFQLFVKDYLKEGEDFGTIPGTPKPTLLKPGADKLCELYGLGDNYRILDKVEDYDAHPALFDYTVECTLVRLRTGQVISTGLGSCSTYESRYRWRHGSRKCPKCGSDAIIKGKAEFGGGFICFAKKGGCGAKFADNDKAITGQSVGRTENEDIVDQKNTVLKMAKKRAKIDATLSATRSSGIFTQDVEDMDVGDGRPMTQGPPAQSTPVQSRTTRKAAPAKSEDVKCAQCGGINGHESDCPTKQPKQAKQAEGKVVEPENKNRKGWLYVNQIEEKKTKGPNGRPYLVLACTDRQNAKFTVYAWHKTLIENKSAMERCWIEAEVSVKTSAQDASKTLLSLEAVTQSEDDNGITFWKDNTPTEEDLSEQGMTAEDAGFDTP